MRYAICNEVYGDWPFEKAYEHARRSGYQGLEIAPFTMGADVRNIGAAERQRVANIAKQNELEIIGLHWLLAGTKGLHLTSPDADIRSATKDYLAYLVDLCADLGGSLMVFGSPNERNLMEGVSQDAGDSFAIEILEPLIPRLEKTNIVLAIEPLGPEETNYLNTAESAVRLIDKLGSPYVRLHLDVKAMATESSPIADIITANANHLHHFHANDPNRQGPGMGAIEYDSILAAIRQIEYEGWISVEVFDYEPGIEKLVSGSIEYLKTIDDGLNRQRPSDSTNKT